MRKALIQSQHRLFDELQRMLQFGGHRILIIFMRKMVACRDICTTDTDATHCQCKYIASLSFTGTAAANAFRAEVEQVIKKSRTKVYHISIPATGAYCLLMTLLSLFAFAVLIVFANYWIWNHDLIWQTTAIIGGYIVVTNAIIIYLSHKGWM